ncbi:LPS translocon maturation chaperone LptM [Plesiomonas sp.]|uniref:LPS translocon maturation chaperone LptM n=1 Tax=Plesiomonas sp. TaxID=2486279 RepID=UPI003F317DD0
MKNSLCRALALCALFTLAGCGVKGPLYMPAPVQPSAPVKAPAANTTTESAPVSKNTTVSAT